MTPTWLVEGGVMLAPCARARESPHDVPAHRGNVGVSGLRRVECVAAFTVGAGGVYPRAGARGVRVQCPEAVRVLAVCSALCVEILP